MHQRELSDVLYVTQSKITCVIAVASAITKGTFAKRANVFARSVLPVVQKRNPITPHWQANNIALP